MFSASASPALVATSPLPPAPFLEEGSVDGPPRECDYSMEPEVEPERELEPELMPAAESEVANPIDCTRAAQVHHTRGRLSVLKETLLPQRDARLEMLHRDRQQRDLEHSLRVQFMQEEAERARQKHRAEMTAIRTAQRVQLSKLRRLF